MNIYCDIEYLELEGRTCVNSRIYYQSVCREPVDMVGIMCSELWINLAYVDIGCGTEGKE